MKFIKVAAASLLFWGCSTTAPPPENDILCPEIDIIQVKENSDKALKIAQETKLEVDMLTAKAADLTNQMVNLREELKPVSPARLDELENKIMILTERLNLAKSQQAQAPEIKKPKEQIPKGSKPVEQIQQGFRPAPEIESGSYQDQEEKKYRTATGLYNQGKFSPAVSAFLETINFSPSGRFAPESYYWTGMCHFNLNDYADAIASLQKVFSYPQSQKRDDAQFQIGICYEKLGDKTQSILEYNKLLTDFPESEYASLVKKIIAKLEP